MSTKPMVAQRRQQPVWLPRLNAVHIQFVTSDPHALHAAGILKSHNRAIKTYVIPRCSSKIVDYLRVGLLPELDRNPQYPRSAIFVDEFSALYDFWRQVQSLLIDVGIELVGTLGWTPELEFSLARKDHPRWWRDRILPFSGLRVDDRRSVEVDLENLLLSEGVKTHELVGSKTARAEQLSSITQLDIPTLYPAMAHVVDNISKARHPLQGVEKDAQVATILADGSETDSAIFFDAKGMASSAFARFYPYLQGFAVHGNKYVLLANVREDRSVLHEVFQPGTDLGRGVMAHHEKWKVYYAADAGAPRFQIASSTEQNRCALLSRAQIRLVAKKLRAL